MRAGDIDQGGETWVYTPARHKAEHHDKPREVLVGPRGREVLRPWLKADPGAYLFSPAEATLERREAMRGRRQTRVQPSQADRSKFRPKKVPGTCYTVASYRTAIRVSHPNKSMIRRSRCESDRSAKRIRPNGTSPCCRPTLRRYLKELGSVSLHLIRQPAARCPHNAAKSTS